ncbi:hypothetical protein N7456_007023 [Penicillium angulare]|uniref:Uncharacterized protein n=1 Tax=Penicillium angulare TaxID=116970 RepID=A0A9W9FIQ7_9EURO|nr:hypothetical protein N7456_007023 [Penicillium angulare]
MMHRIDDSHDLECLLAVVRLMVNGLLPPSKLCPSIIAIFEQEEGISLTECMIGSNTVGAKIFEASLNITKYRGELHQMAILMDRIESLPAELIDMIIQIGLFSDPLGSHNHLHTFRALSQGSQHPQFQARIAAVLAMSSTRENIYQYWKVYYDFDHVSECGSLENQADLDLPTWLAQNCNPCLEFLLSSQALPASSYNSKEDSLLWHCWKTKNIKAGAFIISSMSSKELFNLVRFRDEPFEPKTIIMVCTWHLDWFKACWGVIKSDQNVTLSSLGSEGIYNICKFADIHMANELLCSRGLDLGKPLEGHESAGWGSLLSNSNAVEMGNWFISRGHRPPVNLVTKIAMSGSTELAHWALQNIHDYPQWREGALILTCQPESSTELLRRVLEYLRCDTIDQGEFAQALIKNIVESCCAQHFRYPGSCFPRKVEVDGGISTLEEVAIGKIRIVRSMQFPIEVVGMKILTRQVGLTQLTKALEELESVN